MIWKKRIIIFIYLNTFIIIYSDIVNNPIKTNNQTNPLDFYILFDSYVARPFSANYLIKITTEVNPVKFDGKNYTYSPNFFYINSQNNTYFYANHKVYKFEQNSDGIISVDLIKSIPYNYEYIGYIAEKQFKSDSNSKDYRCPIDNDEIILYGIKEKSIFFYYIVEQESYNVSFNYTINSISCKLLVSDYYVCAFDQNYNLYVIILSHLYGDNNQKELIKYMDIYHPSDIPYRDKVILYDTNKDHFKILCSANKGNNDSSCIIIRCDNNNWKSIKNKNLDSYSISFLINEDNCYSIEFNSEFLLCCGEINQISCRRKNISFQTINEFQIKLSGEIKNLTMINNINYVTMSYINESSNEKYLYNYYIYPPKCHNYSKEITIFQEEKFLLFEKKTNTKYYIKFLEYPIENGISKLNGNENISINENIEVKYENVTFSFIATNIKLESFEIIYEVSIEETYSEKCQISLKIKPCYKSCKTCTKNNDESNDKKHNCIQCDNDKGYFSFPEEVSNCYTENEMSTNHSDWYLDKENKTFVQCNPNCKTCNGSSDENCLDCKNELLLYNGKCFEECPNGTFNTKNINGINLCKNCYKNCKTCNRSGNYTKMMCSSCPENNIFYKYNYNNHNYYDCYNISDNKTKGFYNPENSNIISSCKELMDKYIIENTNECIDKPIEGYFISNNLTGLLSPCHFSCLTCSNNYTLKNHNCDSCSLRNFLQDGNCVTNCSDGYYLNNKICLKCHKNCKTCTNRTIINSNKMETEDDEMNCILCKDDYYKLNETNNCYNKTSLNESFYFKDNMFYHCDENCLTCSEGKNEKSNNCISCDNNKDLYLLEDLNNCENSNYTGYYLDNNTNILKRIYYSKSFDQTTSSSEFKSQITKNITAFTNSSAVINGSDFIAVILTSDNIDSKEQLKKGISAIDLGNCTQVIKEYYNISNDESLIILNMESKKNESKKEKEEKNDNSNSFDLGKSNQIEVYDMSGRKLELSVCKEGIKIMKYIGDVAAELNIDSAKNLADSGIDVFNASDEFFNDLCHNYDNNDKDIIIKDRRTDIYKNVSFCQEGCSYIGMDYELMSANCKCDSSFMQNNLDNNNNTDNNNKEEEKLGFKSLKDSVLSNIFPFNIDVIYCYNLLFNIKILKSNIGFIIMLIMLLLQIVFLFIYLYKKLNPIKDFMLTFDKNQSIKNSFPPPKNMNIKSKFEANNNEIKTNIKNPKDKKEESDNKSILNSKRKFQLIDNNNFLYSKKNFSKEKINGDKRNILNQKEDKKLIHNNYLGPIINIQSPFLNINDKNQIEGKIIKIPNNSNYKSKRLFKNKRSLNNKGINNNKKSYNSTALFNVETKGEKNEDKNKETKIVEEIIKLSKTDEDLQNMDYEQAIIHDKRTFLRIYWGFLVDTQIILGTFCTENYLDLMVIKLSFFVYTFQISFFLNAFFYTDEYISDAYHNEGVLDFLSGLPKSIYSFIATLVTTNLLRMLSNSKSELMKLIRDRRKNKNYIYLINIKLRKLRNKLSIYFIFVFLLDLFFLYYVSVFCSVYRNSQKYWFIGCLQSFGIDSLVAIILCIFLSLFRLIAIKKHIKCLYTLTNIISTFL